MVIVGGGMVGISLALILAAQSDWTILLVEAQSMNVASAPKSHYSASFDDRSTALSWTSRNIYQSIGIWDQLSKHLTDIKHIHVSDRGARWPDAHERGRGPVSTPWVMWLKIIGWGRC